MKEFEAYALKHFSTDLAPYSATTKTNPQTGELIWEFSFVEEIKNRFALLCGDAVHNLRTALDIAWYEITSADTPPRDTHKIKFPIYPTKEHLAGFIKAREKQQSIVAMSGKLLGLIKPYRGSGVVGDGLYHLNQLDMIDKHKVVIPQVQVSHIWDSEAQDSTDENVAYREIINTYGIKVKDQGSLSATVIFGQGLSVEGKAVLPTLRWLETSVRATLMLLR